MGTGKAPLPARAAARVALSPPGRGGKLLWFVALWAAGVLSVAAIAGVLKLWLS